MTTATALGYDDLPRLFERMSGDEKHDPSSLSTLDVLLGPLRPRPRGRRPVSPLKGHGPMAYLRGARGQGLLPRGVAGRLRLVRLAARPPPGPRARSGRRDRERLARPRPADRRRRRAAAAGASTAWSATANWTRGSNWEAIQYAGRVGLERPDGGRASTTRPPRTAGRAASRRRFLLEGWTAERVDGRDHDALERAFRAGGAGRPHAVVAEVSDG